MSILGGQWSDAFTEQVIGRFVRGGFVVEKTYGDGRITASIKTRYGTVVFTALIREHRSSCAINGGHVERIDWSWPASFQYPVLPDYQLGWKTPLAPTRHYGASAGICNMILECMEDGPLGV